MADGVCKTILEIEDVFRNRTFMVTCTCIESRPFYDATWVIKIVDKSEITTQGIVKIVRNCDDNEQAIMNLVRESYCSDLNQWIKKISEKDERKDIYYD